MENENKRITIIRNIFNEIKELLPVVIEKGTTKNFVGAKVYPEASQKWFYYVINPKNMDCKILIGRIPAVTEDTPVLIHGYIASKYSTLEEVLNEEEEGYLGGENGNVKIVSSKEDKYPYPLEVTEVLRLNDLDSEPIIGNLDDLSDDEFNIFAAQTRGFKMTIKRMAVEAVEEEIKASKEQGNGEENDE